MPWSVQRVLQRDGGESWTVTDSSFDVVAPVDRFLAHLGAVDRSPGTVRSYAFDLRGLFHFDGLVASAGDYVEVGGEVLVDRRFPADLAARTVAALDAHNAVYILEAQESLHVPPAASERLRNIIEEHFSQAPDGRPAGSSAILDALRPAADLAATPFAKASVFDSPVSMEQLVLEIGEGVAVVANSIADEGRHSGELYQQGISKADGVAAAIAHLGIARKDTIAVGDGENDLEMIAFAGVGVVIEGSSAELMALADRTAAPPQEEGLVAAFAELGLI